MAAAFAGFAWAQDAMIVKAVEPEWGFDTAQRHVIEPVWVEVTVDRSGEPLAYTSETGLPGPLEKALRRYRFQKQREMYVVGITVQIRRPLQGYWPRPGVDPQELPAEALRQLEKLDLAKAKSMEATLPDKAESAAERSILVSWAAANPGPDADAIRARQIEWLVEHSPGSSVLAKQVSFLNSREGPSANAQAYAKVRQAWLNALKSGGVSLMAYKAAARFFRVNDPELAENILKQLEGRSYVPTLWLGELYVWAGLGVTGLDLDSGTAVTAGEALPQTPFAMRARSTLEKATDPRLLRAAMDTLQATGQSLGAVGEVPAGFNEFCSAVLRQAQTVLPDIDGSCEAAKPGSFLSVEGAKATSQPMPQYPRDARRLGFEGRVAFLARIGMDGKVYDLELAMGAFMFADAARGYLSQWKFLPTLVNGQPVDATTYLEVNFDLR